MLPRKVVVNRKMSEVEARELNKLKYEVGEIEIEEAEVKRLFKHGG